MIGYSGHGGLLEFPNPFIIGGITHAFTDASKTQLAAIIVVHGLYSPANTLLGTCEQWLYLPASSSSSTATVVVPKLYSDGSASGTVTLTLNKINQRMPGVPGGTAFNATDKLYFSFVTATTPATPAGFLAALHDNNADLSAFHYARSFSPVLTGPELPSSLGGDILETGSGRGWTEALTDGNDNVVAHVYAEGEETNVNGSSAYRTRISELWLVSGGGANPPSAAKSIGSWPKKAGGTARHTSRSSWFSDAKDELAPGGGQTRAFIEGWVWRFPSVPDRFRLD